MNLCHLLENNRDSVKRKNLCAGVAAYLRICGSAILLLYFLRIFIFAVESMICLYFLFIFLVNRFPC